MILPGQIIRGQFLWSYRCPKNKNGHLLLFALRFPLKLYEDTCSRFHEERMKFRTCFYDGHNLYMTRGQNVTTFKSMTIQGKIVMNLSYEKKYYVSTRGRNLPHSHHKSRPIGMVSVRNKISWSLRAKQHNGHCGRENLMATAPRHRIIT